MRNCYEKFFLSTISFYVSLQQSWEKFPLNFKVRASPQAVMSYYMDDVNQSICHNSIFVLTHQEKGLIWCPTFRSMRILEYIFLFSFLVAPFYYSSLFSFTLSFIFSVIVVYVLEFCLYSWNLGEVFWEIPQILLKLFKEMSLIYQQ